MPEYCGWRTDNRQIYFVLYLSVVFRNYHQINGGKVLDVGCGNGFVCGLPVDFLGYDYIGSVDDLWGIDIEPNDRYGGTFVQADVHDLPFKGEFFDYAVCFTSFDHFEKPLVASREIHRMLKPGGTFWLLQSTRHDLPKPTPAEHKSHFLNYSTESIVGLLLKGLNSG
jgi:ubiquinone/menaquinone biosynthesis C-methylase UbiE